VEERLGFYMDFARENSNAQRLTQVWIDTWQFVSRRPTLAAKVLGAAVTFLKSGK
jgi:hypothetical protein